MLRIFLVLFTHEFKEFGIGLNIEFSSDRPWSRVCFWIVDSHFHIHVSEIAPAETFDKVQILAGRMAGLVEPGFTIGPDGIDDKPVAFPSSDGVALPRGPVHQLRQWPSVGKDLPGKWSWTHTESESVRVSGESLHLAYSALPASAGRWRRRAGAGIVF